MDEYRENTSFVEQEKPFDIDELLRYWNIIKERYWIFISTFIIVGLSGFIYTFNITPVYKATTTIIIEPDFPQVANLNTLSRVSNTDEFFQTQIKIINSRIVAEKTLDILHPIINKQLEDDEEQPSKADLIDAFIARIDIETDKNTRLVELSMKNTDPKRATEEVNTLAKTYINYNLEDRRATSKDAFLWLSEQLSILKAKVENSEMDLLKYKEAENIVSLEKRQTLLEEQIAEANQNYIKTTTKYAELTTLLDEIKKLQNTEFAESLPRIIDNPLIQQLKQEKSKLEVEMAKVSKKYKPMHPVIVNIQSQIDNIKERLHIETEKIIKSIEIEARITEANIRTIENNSAKLKQMSMSLSKQAIQYGVLKREAESNKNMYDVLLFRLKETDISGRVTANNIRIVDEAIVSDSPVIPNTKLYLFATLVLALGLGAGFCFLAEFFDNTIKSENDIKLHLHETVLGVIPFNKNAHDINDDSFSHFNRSYNEIKTNIRFYQKEHMLKTVQITSAQESEGKTTTVYNIGKAFAQTGSKVLMMDADLFRPKLGKILQLQDTKGVSDYFINNVPASDCIMNTDIKNLFIMPAGLIPPNPSDLIGSSKMKELIDSVKNDYDIILIDSPPVNSTIDVSVLGSYADGIAMVIKAQNTSKQNLRKAIQGMKALNGNIIGTVITSSKYMDKFSYYLYGAKTEQKSSV